MKRFTFIYLLIALSAFVKAQSNMDFGILLGGSYYNGQINPTKQFYKPSFSKGGFIRFNVDDRHSVRLSGYHASLNADIADLSDSFYPPQSTDVSNLPSNLLDVSLQFEFNFLPYITGVDEHLQSIYLAGGIGYSYVFNGPVNSINIPFGLGYKLNITDRLSGGLEWSFRKTFSDEIDGVKSPLGSTFTNNNDWYSFFGLFISYKFFKFAANCPVYN